MFNVVLLEPEIPANTGNIVRTCSVTGCSLHLIEPLGFSIDDKHLKRAGLDYWQYLDIHIHKDLDEFMRTVGDTSLLFLATTKGEKCYSEIDYPEGCYLMFGKETKGLPKELLASYPDQCLRIPMCSEVRSINLSNSVAIFVYEALRQHNFSGLKKTKDS